MPSVIDQLVCGLNRIADADDSSATEDFSIDPPIAISPWGVWFLVCALRHLLYKRTVDTLLIQHIFPKPDPQSEFHLHSGRRGHVPGSPQLEYEVWSSGIDVSDRATGRRLWTDLVSRKSVTAWELITTLGSTKQLEFPEQRLLALHPSVKSLYATVKEFDGDVNCGDCQNYSHDEIYFGKDLDALLKAWARVEPLLESRENRLCLAALFNDAAFLLQELNTDELGVVWSGRNDANSEDRRKRLYRLLPDERWSPYTLHALSDIDDPDLETLIEANLRSNRLKGYDYTTEQLEALAIVGKRGLSNLYPVVLELVHRHGPRGAAPRLGVWWSGLEILLEAGEFVPELIRELESPPHHFALEAANMSIRFAPHLSRQLFQNAIERGAHGSQERAAGILAILDEPWSREVLLKVMTETDDSRALDLCLQTLRESSDHDVRQEASRIWHLRVADESKSSIFKSIDFEMFRLAIRNHCEEIFPLRGRVK